MATNALTGVGGAFVAWGTTKRIYRARWVDQCASRPPSGVWIDDCRFGGEDAGMPVVFNFAGPNCVYPYAGSVISLTNSQVSAGLAAVPDSSVVNLQTDVPQSLFIRDNFYLADAPFVKTGAGFTLSTYFAGIAAISANVKWKFSLEPNSSHGAGAAPAEIIPYSQSLDPEAMFSAIPTSGVWVSGQRVWNSTPAAGGPVGWVCVNGGTPGIWAEFGTIAPSTTVLSLANGANQDISLTSNYCRITGPTAAFELTSIAGGVDGRQVTFLNTTTQTMTVKHATGTTAANQIYCRNAANVAVVGQYGSVTLRYCKVDSTNFRWQVICTN